VHTALFCSGRIQFSWAAAGVVNHRSQQANRIYFAPASRQARFRLLTGHCATASEALAAEGVVTAGRLQARPGQNRYSDRCRSGVRGAIDLKELTAAAAALSRATHDQRRFAGRLPCQSKSETVSGEIIINNR
jgi:hypothetical protein